MYESSWNEQENEYWKKKQAEKHIKQARERAMNRQDYLTNKAYKAFNTISKPSVPEKPQKTISMFDLPILRSVQLKQLSKRFPVKSIISKSRETRETSITFVSHTKHLRIAINLQGQVTIHYQGTRPEYLRASCYQDAVKIITSYLK
jgi:hypothetical protein